MIEVGLLSWSLPPEKSGLSRAAWEIACALTDAGARVRAFTMDRAGRERRDGIAVIGCAGPPGALAVRARGWVGIGHLAGPLAFRRAVLAEHAARPFDVIEATNWYAPAAALALLGGPPVVTRCSTPNAVSIPPAATWREAADRAAAVAIERLSARAGAGLISNTRDHAAKMAALYGVAAPGPGHAVIGLSLPGALTARGAAAAYPAGGAPVRLLFVGRDEPRKGFDALAGAAAILGAEGADFHLTVVGVRADALAGWPEAARARTTAHHRVPDAVLHDLLADAHVVVAPSRYESFGLVYQEAMAFGRPIAACAEDPSARLFVGESGAGVLAAACTGAALADALRPLIADGGLRAAVAARSRAAGGRFTRERLAAETLAAYASAIASKGRSRRASSHALAPSGASAP